MSHCPERSFGRMMFPPDLRSNKLMIPKDFASQYHKEIGSYCYLQVPKSDTTHQVELTEEDDELWFGYGFQEFMDAFSIASGYFLFFIYQKDSYFKVIIFDETSCEISYELSHDDDSSYGSSEELEIFDSESESESQSESESETSYASITMSFGEFQYSKYPWLNQCEDILRALAYEGIAVPNNPFFVTRIQEDNLNGKLIIPFSFAEKYIVSGLGRSVIVKEKVNGKEWSIRRYKDNLSCSLHHGWSDLALQMHLEIGDICLFEITDVKNSVFDLLVIKA